MHTCDTQRRSGRAVYVVDGERNGDSDEPEVSPRDVTTTTAPVDSSHGQETQTDS